MGGGGKRESGMYVERQVLWSCGHHEAGDEEQGQILEVGPESKAWALYLQSSENSAGLHTQRSVKLCESEVTHTALRSLTLRAIGACPSQ